MYGDLLSANENGLYCSHGDFYIDPWRPVERAIITHGHSDHARSGSRRYLTTPTGVPILRSRLNTQAHIRALPFGESLEINGVRVSLHPAGHILGSAQVCVEWRGQVWVVSGDYKTVADPTCEAFTPVACHVFITESTFGLPIYRWRPQPELIAEINDWWRTNQTAGRTSVIYAYALGKAQRILGGLDPSIGPILVHGAVYRATQAYLQAGIDLPTIQYADTTHARAHRGQALVIAPPSAAAMSGWLTKFGDTSSAFASGWMQIRGARRRRAADRGFVLSDHADWSGLLDAIRATDATRIGVTHGYTTPMVRYLREQGWEAEVFDSRYAGEGTAEEAEADASESDTIENAALITENATADTESEFSTVAVDGVEDS